MAAGSGAGLIATMPKECRYTGGRLIFNTNDGSKTMRIDYHPNGHLVREWAGKEWVAVSGIVFPTNPNVVKNLALKNGWVNYGGEFAPAVYARKGGFCWLGGLIVKGKWGLLAQLPPSCRPSSRLAFFVIVGYASARVDVYPNGEVRWISGGMRKVVQISLTGIFFKVAPEASPPMKFKSYFVGRCSADQVITSSAECGKAAAALGYKDFRGGQNQKVLWKGCDLQNVDSPKFVLFNTNPNPSVPGWVSGQFKQLCGKEKAR
eukprot:TRINITY_DN2778_c0_g1_i4.p1 TRINITY_DN2778_c0_g1~~TRINITY_DN2778_c0_g1_i4.p1  ORF type:complete len:262 (-),score=37.63 TRINITY_DN2778_c0_g1_i4:399-1184(-)